MDEKITAKLGDGPMRGDHIEVELLGGRPPMTLDLAAVDGSTRRYCLAELIQSGSSARYTFLYRV
jgi:hypothetical protein